ncbi:arsenate reductase ArsC [Legionella pneumophila]|uniref:arsenate reductase ArsC n=1 Tax=Legionella pneumophila TaxID=446 RepID=UPI00086348B1|nr:arsenate reductase ArsC [Legionella pneumophila]AOU64473.1 hypothetical protein A9E90_10245 [Legionella pneumophila]
MKILFLCTSNSACSPIAEALAKQIFGKNAEVFSAGSNPANRVHPLAMLVMKELDIDLGSHTPKSIENINLSKMDVVITLNEEENSHKSAGNPMHYFWNILDPASPYLTASEQLEMFGHVRDKLKKKIMQLERSLISRGH